MSEPLETRDIVQVLEALGGLHDARLRGLRWDAVGRTVAIDVDDIYANSEGMAGYEGPKVGKLTFDSVTRLDADVPLGDRGLLVFDCTVHRNDGGSWLCTLAFSPGGRIVIESARVELSPGTGAATGP